MSSIQAGDVVVCVDDNPCWHSPYPGARFPIRARRTLRVVGTRQEQACPYALLFAEYGQQRFDASRFRKVQKADDSFIRQIKACRPIPHDVESDRG